MSGVSFNLGCMDISCVRIGGRATCSVMRGSSSHVSFCTASFLIDCVAAVSLPRFLRPLDASSHHVRRTYQVSLPATKCLASTCGAVRWAMWRRGCMDISCVRIGGRATCSVMRGSSSHVSFCTASFLIDCVAAVSLPRFLRPLDASSHHVRRTYQVSLPATKCLASTCGVVRWAMWRRERGSRPHCHRASSTSVNKPHHLFVSMHT